MSQFEILPLIEKYYPIKLFVKVFVWVICKVSQCKRVFTKANNDQVSIIALHKIGDSIFTIHAIKKIIKFHQEKIISIICFPETKAIYQIAFPTIRVITISHNYFWKGRVATKNARKILYETKSEIVFDLTGAITSATLIIFSRARQLVGMNLEYFKPLYDNYTSLRETPHLIDMYLDVVRMVIPVEDNIEYEFPFKSSNSEKILIHPGAGWTAKEWGIKNYLSLAERLSFHYQIEFISEFGYLSEDDKNRIQAKFNLTQSTTVEDMIGKIKDCSVLIGNDSGPIYIANMLGKSTFTIYGPTNPKYSKPFGEHHIQVHKEVSCSPIHAQYCFTDAGRKCHDYICMRNLKVDEVYYNLNEFLNKEMISHHKA